MTILITGGGGYLGTVLARQLLSTTPHALVILDRFDWGVQPLLSVPLPQDLPRVQIIRGDVRQVGDVKRAAHQVDRIIHLAGIVGYPACDADPQDADATNVLGTQIVCETGIPVIFASTGSCYGKVEGIATEETPLSPLTRYGRNKAAAEKMVLAAGGTVLRLATLFGLSPRMRWDLLPNDFCRRGIAGEIQLFEGDARRTFLHVEDAARAFSYVIDGVYAPGIWNVGHASMNWTKRQVADAVQALTGCAITESTGNDPDQRDYVVEYTKMRGFRPRYSLATSLSGLVAAARMWR